MYLNRLRSHTIFYSFFKKKCIVYFYKKTKERRTRPNWSLLKSILPKQKLSKRKKKKELWCFLFLDLTFLLKKKKKLKLACGPKHIWNNLRTYKLILHFNSWYMLLNFFLRKLLNLCSFDSNKFCKFKQNLRSIEIQMKIISFKFFNKLWLTL